MAECRTTSAWWFGAFFIFPYVGNNYLNWLIFFRGVETTNQTWSCNVLHRVIEIDCTLRLPTSESVSSQINPSYWERLWANDDERIRTKKQNTTGSFYPCGSSLTSHGNLEPADDMHYKILKRIILGAVSGSATNSRIQPTQRNIRQEWRCLDSGTMSDNRVALW